MKSITVKEFAEQKNTFIGMVYSALKIPNELDFEVTCKSYPNHSRHMVKLVIMNDKAKHWKPYKKEKHIGIMENIARKK